MHLFVQYICIRIDRQKVYIRIHTNWAATTITTARSRHQWQGCDCPTVQSTSSEFKGVSDSFRAKLQCLSWKISSRYLLTPRTLHTVYPCNFRETQTTFRFGHSEQKREHQLCISSWHSFYATRIFSVQTKTTFSVGTWWVFASNIWEHNIACSLDSSRLNPCATKQHPKVFLVGMMFRWTWRCCLGKRIMIFKRLNNQLVGSMVVVGGVHHVTS